MRPLRLAVATRCLRAPLKPSLLLAAQLGAGGVQLDVRNELTPGQLSVTGRRELLHVLSELGLAVATLDFPLRRGLIDPDRLDARLDAIKSAMTFAYELKAKALTVRLGGLPAETDAAGLEQLKTVLNDLARHGNRVGVTLALGLSREAPPQMAELLGDIVEGPIGVNFDPAAVVANGQSPGDALACLKDFIAHVLVRDATSDSSGFANEVPLGRGEVPWEEMLALLSDINYGGWLTVDRTQGEDQPGDAGRAIQYLSAIYRG